MKKILAAWAILAAVVSSSSINAQQPAPRPRLDTATMERPIEMRDSVWMAELTELEARDLIKSGKTTAIVISGGLEGNGPYLVLDKHNLRAKVQAEAVARKLGNALVAPVITIEPGDPANARTAGAPVFSNETFKAVCSDIAISLRAMGFKDIVFLGDSGGNLQPMEEVAHTLNSAWKGQGARIHFVDKYGSSAADSGCCGWSVAQRYIKNVLGIQEVLNADGLHEEYSVDALVMIDDPDAVRIKERMKAGLTTINGVDLVPVEKTIENGRRLSEYLATQTVQEIQRQINESKSK